jgi:hypothetical protein
MLMVEPLLDVVTKFYTEVVNLKVENATLKQKINYIIFIIPLPPSKHRINE